MNIVAREVKHMPALRWAAAAAVAGILVGDVAVAAADPPPDASPTLTPTTSPTPAPTASPTPAPETPVLPFPTPPPDPSGTTIYVMTVTTTTTAVNAPITWVAAPISTTVSNTSSNPAAPGSAGSLEQTGAGRNAKLEVDLAGCGASSPAAKHKSPQRAQLRLPQSGTLMLRVNGRRVGSLQLPSTSRGVPLRIELGKDGMLSVRRPSGSVLHVRACSASKEAS